MASRSTDPLCRALTRGAAPLPGWKSVAVMAVHVLLLLGLYTDVSPLAERIMSLGVTAYVSTGGLLSSALLTGIIRLAALALLLFGWARLRPRDVGLCASQLPKTLALLGGLWVAMQAAALVVSVTAEGAVRPNHFAIFAPRAFLGELLSSMLSAALLEETLYRGFLMAQIYGLAARWWPASDGSSRRKRLLLALLLPQVLFGLAHVPTRLDLGAGVLSVYIVQVILMGVFLGLLYLVTANLFLAIGVHALVNAPSLIFEVPIEQALLPIVFSSLLLVLWAPIRDGLLHVAHSVQRAAATGVRLLAPSSAQSYS